MSRSKQVDTLMEQASQALAKTDYFGAERLAEKALVAAREAGDFDRMARIVLPLQEARRQRLQLALEVGTITIVEEPVEETATIEPGCYLVRPPRVGADARRLRLQAHQQNTPVAVVCREPVTQLGLCPVVAIGPGVTVRTRMDPPANPDEPDLAWFVEAMETLGDFAIESIDPEMAVLKRLDVLLGRLDAIPEHENLHHAVEEACREAEQETRAEEKRKAEAKAAKAKAGAKRKAASRADT